MRLRLGTADESGSRPYAEKLDAQKPAHHPAKEIIKETDKKSDGDRDADDHERVCGRCPARRPDDMRELFAHVLQVGEWVHGLGCWIKKALAGSRYREHTTGLFMRQVLAELVGAGDGGITLAMYRRDCDACQLL